MADVKISDLTAVSGVNTGDLFETEHLGKVQLKGLSSKIAVYNVIAGDTQDEAAT